MLSAGEIEAAIRMAGFRILKIERYTVRRELDEWLARAAADDATRGGGALDDRGGAGRRFSRPAARRSRDGNITFTENRIRLLAEFQARPA